MRIEPDAGSALGDEDRLDALVAGCLRAAGCAAGMWEPTDLRYPGLHAMAHRSQRPRRAGTAPPDQEPAEERVPALVLAARHSQARARLMERNTGWAVDLAPRGEGHLTDSVLRALRQVPAPADGVHAARTVAVTDWGARQRDIFEEGCRVLRSVWPQMFAELRVTLRQVALLGGWGIDGFTDFTVHGAVFVNSQRLSDQEPGGLEGRFRLVEALVHEGTHNRCDAAAASAAFLRASGTQETMSTPLRADPRPLAGLFQQVAVLARSVLLYRRLPQGPAVRARHDLLLEQGRRGAAALRSRAGALTEAGQELLEQAEAVFAAGVSGSGADTPDGTCGRVSDRTDGTGGRVSDRADWREDASPSGPAHSRPSRESARTPRYPSGPATESTSSAGLADWPVQTVSPFPEAPWFLLGRTAARSGVFSPSDAASGRPVLIGAAAGTDRADVALRARGELMERTHNVLAGRRAREGEVIASYASLRRRGQPALDPWSWPELRPLTGIREAAMPWVTGRSLTGGGPVLVPASAVYLAHRPPAGCPAPLRPGSTGLAAHPTPARAREHAVLEIWERDLLWHAWYADAPRQAPPGQAPLDEESRRVLTVLGLRERCLVLPGPGGTACVVACVHESDHTGQTFGARATSGALGPAVVSAIREALMVRWSMGTASASAAWDRMRERDQRPNGPLEHALHTFHRQDSLTPLLRGATDGPWTTAGGGAVAVADLLAERTAEDVIEVDTSIPTADSGRAVVVRVVAPGARRLPTDEQDRATLPGGHARRQLPHPLG